MSEKQQTGKIGCPHCGAMIKSLGLAVGSAVNCPKCGQGFRVGEEVGSGGQGSGVRGQETGARGQGTGAGVQGPKPKVQGRLVAKPVRELPQPPGTARGQGAGARSQETGDRGQGTGVGSQDAENPKSPISNPKSAKPDVLVDPNLLPPPPPRVKEKPKEVAVVCLVCGTRTYAPLEKIGQTVKCPDCYSQIEVPALKEETGDRGQGTGGQGTRGPTLEDVENFGMSEVVERPKYRPLQAARGEYEVLSALDPAAMEQRFTVPGEKPRHRGRGTGDREQGTEDAEIALAPVEERAEAARDPRTILPRPEMEPENTLYDGKYDDGVIGDMVDPRTPDAWKKAPFVYGIVEFLFFSSTILRLVMFAVLLVILSRLARWGIAAAQAEDRTQILALFIIWAGIPTAAVWLFSFGAAFQAIVETTANGENEVVAWPDWNVFGWIAPATFILLAALISSIPGVAVAVATFAASLDDPLMAAFGMGAPVVLSCLVLFPVVVFSMLAEESVFAVISGQTVGSFKNAGDAWVVFYTYSIVVALLGTAAGAMLSAENFLVAALGAAAMAGLLMVYARLVGRLMWVSGQRESKAKA